MAITDKQDQNLFVAKINAANTRGCELFSTILYSIPVYYTEDPKLPTACTNGLEIQINPFFFESQSIK